MFEFDARNLAFLLSDDYREILENSLISASCAIDDDDENNDVWMGCAVPSDVLWASPDGNYEIVDGDGERPLVVLLHRGDPVGYYVDMGAWIDPEHRGKGLGTGLVLVAASRYGRSAFINHQVEDPRHGLGFSESGFELHDRVPAAAEAMIEGDFDFYRPSARSPAIA